MPDNFIGEIRITAFNYAPTGWALCNGQILPIAQNTALFSLLGTRYGGNGATTFALPDLRDRVPLHMHPGDYPEGGIGGEAAHALAESEMPVHIHALMADPNTAPANGVNAVSASVVLSQAGGHNHDGSQTWLIPMYGTGDPTGTLNPACAGVVGQSLPHNNMMPYLAVSFCIAMIGIFPSRN